MSLPADRLPEGWADLDFFRDDWPKIRARLEAQDWLPGPDRVFAALALTPPCAARVDRPAGLFRIGVRTAAQYSSTVAAELSRCGRRKSRPLWPFLVTGKAAVFSSWICIRRFA